MEQFIEHSMQQCIERFMKQCIEHSTEHNLTENFSSNMLWPIHYSQDVDPHLDKVTVFVCADGNGPVLRPR